MSSMSLTSDLRETLKITSNKHVESVNSCSTTLWLRRRPTYVLMVTAALLMYANAIKSPAIAEHVFQRDLFICIGSVAVLFWACNSMIMYLNCVRESWLLANETSEYPKTRTVDDSSFGITRETWRITVYRTAWLRSFMKFRLATLNWSSPTCASVVIANNRYGRVFLSQRNFIRVDRKTKKAVESASYSSFQR